MDRSPPRALRTAVALALVVLFVVSGLARPEPAHAAARTLVAPAATEPTVVAAPGTALPANVHPSLTMSPWVNITPGLNVSPSSRSGAMFAYDAADGYMLLFGGLGNGVGALSDTWKFENGSWTDITVAVGAHPPPRYKGSMVFDEADNYIVLYGGQASTYLGDTWTFSGGHWNQINTTTAPSPREDTALAYDGADHYVLLFAGEQPDTSYTNDTWAYSAGVWTNLTGSLTTPAPPALESSSMGYDPTDSEVVLFGGKPTESSTSVATWVYHNLAWMNITSTLATAPGQREGSQFVWDPADGYLFLFGGLHFPNALNDTWAFVSNQWVEVPSPSAPPARFAPAVAFYPSNGFGYAILFGGQLLPSVNASAVNDTWTFKVPLAASVSVSPAIVDQLDPVTIGAAVNGGYQPYNLSWIGLPASCSPAGTTFFCNPNETGAFAIQVSATDDAGVTVLSAPVNLSVNPLPFVNTSVSPTIGIVPLTANFSAVVFGGTGPFGFSWQFGDAATATGPSASHTYTTAGAYDAVVTVTDALGHTATGTAATVTVVEGLLATAAASPSSGLAPLAVNLSAIATGGEAPYTYAWNFGDGSATSTAVTTAHTFAVAGSYNATVTITDGLGQVASAAVGIQVYTPLAASFYYSLGSPYCADQASFQDGEFTATVTGGSGDNFYIWEFPNETLTGSATVNYSVAAGLTYPVVLTVEDGAGEIANSTQTIPVSAETATNCAAASGSGTAAFPWLYVLIAIIAVAIAIELLVMLRRRRRPPAAPPPATPVPAEPAPADGPPPPGTG